MFEARGFDESRMLDGDPFDLGSWFHDVHFLKGFDGPGDDHASRRHSLVGWVRVVRSWSRGKYAAPHAADLFQCGFRESRSTPEANLNRAGVGADDHVGRGIMGHEGLVRGTVRAGSHLSVLRVSLTTKKQLQLVTEVRIIDDNALLVGAGGRGRSGSGRSCGGSKGWSEGCSEGWSDRRGSKVVDTLDLLRIVRLD